MSSTRRTLAVVLIAAGAVALAGVAGAAARDRRPRRARPGRPQLTVGQAAPDFELAPLTFERNAQGERVGRIGKKKVKLSAFRGKAPVCIFASSYT